MLIRLLQISFLVIPLMLFLCVCSLPAVWLALGRTHLLARLTGYLASTLLLGFTLVLVEGDREEILYYYLSAVTLIGASLTRMHFLLRPIVFGIGVFLLLPVYFQANQSSLDSTWVVRITLGMSAVAGLVAVVRALGFRIVDLTEGISREEIERGTGRDFDEWFALLDRSQGKAMNHAAIRAFVRAYGVSDEWQKSIAVAYEKALGRRTIGLAADGKPQVIADNEVACLFAARLRPQFSVWQLMVATFVVATLSGYLHLFTRYRLVVEDLTYGVPMVLGVAAINITAVCACLAVRGMYKKTAAAVVVALGVGAAITELIGMPSPITFLRSLAVPGVLTMLAMLLAALLLVRHRGYRMVRTLRTAAPTTRVPTAPCRPT